MRLGLDPRLGVSVVGVSDRVFILGVSASWERHGRNWRTNYRYIFFWLSLPWLMEDEGTERWQI